MDNKCSSHLERTSGALLLWRALESRDEILNKLQRGLCGLVDLYREVLGMDARETAGTLGAQALDSSTPEALLPGL